MNFGFISTRFAGTDGVSLEAAKWAEVLWMDGHVSHWFSGLSDRQEEISMVVPQAYFGHESIREIESDIWGGSTRSRAVTARIHELTAFLKEEIYEFADRFSIDVLVPQNALTIPMHVPLGLAITEFLAETGMKCIAHHHDFSWERARFSNTGVRDFLDAAFPPSLPNIEHVVINTAAQREISLRKGVTATLIPNVFHFEEEPPGIDKYNRDFRKAIGLSEDDILILQPTRIVPRKGIEHAIELVRQLDDPRCKLVISHAAGDEGFEYLELLERLASEAGVDLRVVADRVDELRGKTEDGKKIYTLWDAYPHADFVTYPSLIEGFGNALLESVYFKKATLVNRYPVYVEDIEPKGFQFPSIDGLVTHDAVAEVKNYLEDDEFRTGAVERNFEIAKQFYGFEELRRLLGECVDRLEKHE
ncbi:MAG: glycosyltransferase family 4 protein [Verrucomicrobiales bacterium]|nr:glycosyltransferase family 4 protein [Verrucomicrobiales bacterium]